MNAFTLVSHHLCAYVQRAAISLAEKDVPFDRIDVDLDNKPGWFTRLSPLGKVPLLRLAADDKEETIFESAVILEYLEETLPVPLHPKDPLERARHRGWIEFGSSILNRIAAFYNASSDAELSDEAGKLARMFDKVEAELGTGPWFADNCFSLVDSVYGPIFRYFDIFDGIADFSILSDKPKSGAWRDALAGRASISKAVAPDYSVRLLTFLKNRESALSSRVASAP